MNKQRWAIVSGLVLALSLYSAVASGQTAGAISGTVSDASGAVLPGVTVEAASAALIEGVRSVTSDGQGRYSIVDLRPGMYSVTFTLPGFSTVRREGIQLTAGFTAAVNAQLQVGALEETVTVSGASPIVDVSNTRTQVVVAAELLTALPTSRSSGNNTYVALVPGSSISYKGRDVGGTSGEPLNAPALHGSDPGLTMIDGIAAVSGHQSEYNKINPNPFSIQETVVETGNGFAEAWTSGVNINVVSKSGGNTFSGVVSASGAAKGWDADNLNDDLRQRGLSATGRLRSIYDWGAGFGGPLKTDRLWFYVSPAQNRTSSDVAGMYYNLFPHTDRYQADLTQQAYLYVEAWDLSGRVTWQAAQKHKFVFQNNRHSWCNMFGPDLATIEPNAGLRACFDAQNLTKATWSYPASNRVLVEASGAFRVDNDFNVAPDITDTLPTDRSYLDVGLNLTYGSFFANPPILNGSILNGRRESDHWITAASVSYVTGSHTLKTGFSTNVLSMIGKDGANFYDEQYVFRNGAPIQINQATTPDYYEANNTVIGLYVQDQWAVKRLTLNLGARFDYINGYAPAQTRPASTYLGPIDLPRADNIPNWKNIHPRLGIAYDLFGTGRTAVKASMGRYEGIRNYGLDMTRRNMPTATLQLATTRIWTDSNGNRLPDCDLTSKAANLECGAMANQAFGTSVVTTSYAEDVTQGWGVSPYIWQGQVSLQHELMSNVGLTVGYFRTSYGNLSVTDNRAVSPSDFSSYCITVPVDPRLPLSGNTLCDGLYDVSPEKFGKNDALVVRAPDHSRVYNGADVLVSARFGGGYTVGGGVSTGQIVTNTCSVPDVPAQFCKQTQPWSSQTQLKVNLVAPLPFWDLQASAVYQNLAGIPQTSTRVYSNSEIAPSLGRNLSSCPASTGPCNATVLATIAEPFTLFENREHQMDVRLSKSFRMGRTRVQANLDAFNLFNIGSVQSIQSRYGTTWLDARSILAGRLIKIGAQLDF